MRTPHPFQASKALALVLAVVVSMITPAAAQYKNSTPIPPSIPATDEVQTPHGTVHMEDGFPDKDSAQTIYDMLDFQRAVQGYLLGLPPVSVWGIRKGMLEWGPANSTVPIFENLMTPKSLFLTANNNTPYTVICLDLHKGPLVLEVPPKVPGLLDDHWFRWAGNVGITGPDEGRGGKYVLLPPGYKGEVPSGYFVIRPATFNSIVFWRSFLVDGSPAPGVEAIAQKGGGYSTYHPLIPLMIIYFTKVHLWRTILP